MDTKNDKPEVIVGHIEYLLSLCLICTYIVITATVIDLTDVARSLVDRQDLIDITHLSFNQVDRYGLAM